MEKQPRCKNGTRRRPNYNNECLSDNEYQERQLAKKAAAAAKNQTKKKKPRLIDSFMNIFTRKEDTVEKELKKLELINADEYKPPKLPESNASSPEVPSLESPLLQTPSSESPSSESPLLQTPSPEVPLLQTPSSESPSSESPSSDVPSSDVPSSVVPLSERPSSNTIPDFLYPSLDDPFLNQKIANRNEFSSFKYDADITRELKEASDLICDNPEFELLNHQLFVKSFISYSTPYRGILLYHGLGSGKTCSAIGIAEELRDHMKNEGITQRILVIASTNVQDNFRLQLFDERRLDQDLDTGAWTNKSCIGNKLIREINPAGAKMTREKIASQAKTIINTSYAFMGYLQFANFIQEKVFESVSEGDAFNEQLEIQNIQRIFNDRLIIIDEVHNCTKEDKRLAKL
jgi:hypothetical protein